MLTSSQTVEDGMARRPPLKTMHFEGTETEFIQLEMAVRRPWSLVDITRTLVIRASRVTGRVTIALEKVTG